MEKKNMSFNYDFYGYMMYTKLEGMKNYMNYGTYRFYT